MTNSTMNTTAPRPRMATHSLDLPAICDVCGKGRSTRQHAKCSKIRQHRKSAEWKSYMANAAAKQALGRRA